LRGTLLKIVLSHGRLADLVEGLATQNHRYLAKLEDEGLVAQGRQPVLRADRLGNDEQAGRLTQARPASRMNRAATIGGYHHQRSRGCLAALRALVIK